mmetsp:Transcript_25207/g.81461  ORF Transcript_25207/g.81461 Transcript_25207/m.81461 type:complete len:301 (-) Transcript_25207:523-1425(-)
MVDCGDLCVQQLLTGPHATQDISEAGTLGAIQVARRSLHLRLEHGQAVPVEDGREAVCYHGNIRCQADEDSGASMVQIVAEADLVGRKTIVRVRVVAGARIRDRFVRVNADSVHLLQSLVRLVIQASGHSLVDSREEPLLTDGLRDARFAHGLLDTVTDHREGYLYASAPEVMHDVLNNMNCCRVHAADWGHLQDNVLRFVDTLQVLRVDEQYILDERSIGKVHRGSNPNNENIRDERSIALLLDVPVDGSSGNSPLNCDLRSYRFIDHDDQRKPHCYQDAPEHTKEERPDKGHNPKKEI